MSQQQTNPIIAIVDDEETSQFLTKIMIKESNRASKIIEFFDGKEVLQFLKDQSENEKELPDIILLDLNMPIMDGWMFLDEFELIRDSLKKNIRIYILTSSISKDDIDRARNYFRVVSFFSKPLSAEMLELILIAPDYYKIPASVKISW